MAVYDKNGKVIKSSVFVDERFPNEKISSKEMQDLVTKYALSDEFKEQFDYQENAYSKYFDESGNPKWYDIYKDFLDKSVNGAFREIKSAVDYGWEVYSSRKPIKSDYSDEEYWYPEETHQYVVQIENRKYEDSYYTYLTETGNWLGKKQDAKIFTDINEAEYEKNDLQKYFYDEGMGASYWVFVKELDKINSSKKIVKSSKSVISVPNEIQNDYFEIEGRIDKAWNSGKLPFCDYDYLKAELDKAVTKYKFFGGYDNLYHVLEGRNDFWDKLNSFESIKSSKEEKVNPNDPHMKFKTLEPEHKMDLREDIEDELEALLKKLHVKFDLETWNETVDYILSFFEEDNFYNPKDAKQAVHEWYLDTKDEFPDMFDSKKTKIASSAYREFIHNKMSIKSTHNLIKSSVEEEDPVEVLLKDAAQQLGATYKEGWWGKGIQEGDGNWNGGNWAVAVKKDYSSNLPSIYFISGPRVTPMNATVEKSERFPKDVVSWIKSKIDDSNASRDSFENNVKQLEHFQNNLINYVDVVNEYNKEVEVGLDTEDDYEARTVAEEIAQQTGFENYEIYDFYELSEDDYRDLDEDARDKKVILFYLG